MVIAGCRQNAVSLDEPPRGGTKALGWIGLDCTGAAGAAACVPKNEAMRLREAVLVADSVWGDILQFIMNDCKPKLASAACLYG